jgi:hypothetical protein
MKMFRKEWLFGGLLGCSLALSGLACDSFDNSSDQAASSDDTSSTRHTYEVQLVASHAHIFKEQTLTFNVMLMDGCTEADPMMCPMVKGLPVSVFYRPISAPKVTQVALEPGILDDGGDGTYTWKHAFGTLGAHLIGIQWNQGGQYYATSYPFETSRAGGEAYLCTIPDSDNVPDYDYQIRWNPSVEPLVADGTTAVTFSIELMGSYNSPVITDKPWTNSFDHLVPERLDGGIPTVELMADKGEQEATLIETLTPQYIGKGIYTVTRTFASADLNGLDQRNFWLKVSLTDALTGCDIAAGSGEDEANYDFTVKKM